METKDKTLQKIKTIYNLCNNKFMRFVLFATALAIIIDILPMYQLVEGILESTGLNLLKLYNMGVAFFDYEISILVDISVVIWAFMVGLSSIFIDRINNRFYGIRISYVIKKYEKNLIGIAIMAIIQLILMMFGVVLELEITLCMVFVWMLNTMIVLFLFVLINLFQETILNLAKEELEDIAEGKKKFQEAPIVNDLISNLDYKKPEEIQILKDTILNRVSNSLKQVEDVSDERKHTNPEKIKNYIMVYNIVHKIMDEYQYDDIEMRNKLRVIQEWFEEKSEGESAIIIKKGILGALMDTKKRKNIECCNQMLKAIKNEALCRELRIWIIANELYKSRFIGQEWRIIIAQSVFREYIRRLTKEDEKVFVESWLTLKKIEVRMQGVEIPINVLWDFLMRG